MNKPPGTYCITEVVDDYTRDMATMTDEERAEQHRQNVTHKARVRAEALAQFPEEDRW
jgi:hypothetical protein